MAYTLYFSGLSEGVRDHDIGAFLCSGQFGYPTIHNGVKCRGSEATVVISGLQDNYFEQLLKPNAFPNAKITVQGPVQHMNVNYGQPVGPGAMAYPGHPQQMQGQPTQWGQPQFGGLHSSPASSVQSLPASFGQQWTGDRPAFRHVADQGLSPQGMTGTRMPESVSNSPFQATQGTPGFSPRLPTHGRPTHPDQSGHPAMQPHPEPASFLPIRPEPLRPGPSYVPPTGQQLPRPPGPHDHRSHSVQHDPMSPPGQDGHGTPYGREGIRHTGPHDHRSQSVQQDYRPPGQEGHRPSYGHQDGRPSSVQQEYRPSSVQHQYRPSSVQQDYRPSVQQQYRPPPGQESHISAYGHQYSRPPSAQQEHRPSSMQQEHRPPSMQQEYRPPSAQQEYRPPSAQQEYRPPSAQQEYRPSSAQHDYRPPPGQQEYRPPPGQHEYRPSPILQGNQIHLTSANESCPSAVHGSRPTFASQEYRPLSASHDVRPPSSTQEYRSPSTPHDFRPPSASHDTSTSEEVEEINSHSHDMQPSPMQTNQPIMVLHGGTESQQSAVQDISVPQDGTCQHPAKEDSPQAQEQADTQNPSSQLCTPPSSHHLTSFSQGVLATTSLKPVTDSPTFPERTVVDVPTSNEGMLSAGSETHVHAQQQHSVWSQSQHQQLQHSFHPSATSTNSPLYQEHSSQYPPQMPQYQHSSQYPPQMPQYQHSSQYPPQMPPYHGDTPLASTQHLQYSPGTQSRPPMVSSLESQRRQSLPIQQGSHSRMQYSSTNPPEPESMHGPPPHSLSEPNPGSTTVQWEGSGHQYHGGSNTQGPRRHPSTTQWHEDGSLDQQDNQWHTPHHQQGHDSQRQPIFQPGRGLEHTDNAFSLAGQQPPVQFETHQEASYGEQSSGKDSSTFQQIASNEEISLAANPTCNPLQSSPAVVTQPRAHVSPHTPGVSDQSASLQGGSHETPSHQEPKSSNSKSDLKLDLSALLDNNDDNTSIVKVTDLELKESDVDTIDDVFSNEDEEGGEIVGIDIAQLNEKGFILITFKDPGVAKQVCKKKQWRVMGQTAIVCLYCKDTNAIKKLLAVARNHPQHSIIILNLPDSERDADVTLRLEKITKLDLEYSTTDKYEHVGTKALLVLSDGDPDFKDSIVSKINDYSKSPKAHKDFAQISALNFPQVKKVIITGVKDEMCHEHKLQPYFANRKKSGGGPGCSVEVVDRGRAVVSFKQSAQADSTLEIDHEKTLGEGVTVQPYHPLFEGWLSESAAAKDTHEQQDFDCEVQSELKCAYLTKNSHHLNEFNNRLRENCATVKLDAAQKVFHVKPRQGSQFIEEWKDKCTKCIEEFLESYREDMVSIPEGTSGAAFKLLFTVAKDNPLVDVNDSQAESVSVVGPAADVATVVERLQRVVNESMDFNEVVKFAPAVLHYVHNHARKKLKEKHPRVDFKASLQEGCIEVIGKTAKCEEFIEALKKIKPSSARVNISPDAVHLLASPVGREHILDKMPKQVEMSHFFTDENDALEDAQMAIYVNLYIVADSSLSAQVRQVAKDIESSLCTKKIDVPKEFQYTVRGQAWNDFKQEVEQRCVAQLLPHAADPLVVICDHQLTEQLAQEIQSFVQENCYTEETVTFSSGQWRFFFDYSREWTIIENDIKKTCEYICVEEGRSTAIHLQGETTPSKTLAKHVRNLRDSICTDKMEVSRPGLVDHFSSEEGRRHIKGIAAALRAVVEVSTAEENEHVTEMIAQEKTHPVLISGTLADGVIVEVRKGDLTELEVDVIVNAANEQLNHGGGVAGQIRSKGGPIIQDESDQYVRRNGSVDIGKAVILKSTGDLPCKNIVHAVGPRWRGGNHNESHLLARATSASLTETVKKGFTSIAFPAIGAGIFGVPIEVCAKAMFEGLCSFFSMSNHQMKVIIMVYQQEHVEPFISEARKSLNDVLQPKMHVMTEHPSGTAPMPRRTSSHTMASAITTDLEISHGSLLDYHADVYINSTSAGLDLNSGAVSKSLLKPGGSALQDECKRHVRQNGSVPEWGFFTSGPGNLKCRKVIHTVGGNYSKGSGRSGMETMITNVMKECDRLKASTVAFPSIGTGALGFPHNIAADIMITTVSTYLSQHRTTAIKKVLFVIFDQPVLKAYKAKKATLPAVQPQLSSAYSSTRTRPSARSRGSNTPTVKLSNLSFQPQPTRPVIGTQIQQGSLTDVVADVYVDTASPDLDLKSRPVSQALLQAGGQALQDECTKHVQQNGNVPAWSFATTGPGALKCKHVLHTVAADYDGPGGSAEKGLEQMMMDMLTECDNLKATTVAIPSIGAGNLKFPPDVVARIMIQSVSNYGQKNSGTVLKSVTFAIFDNTVLQCFQSMHSRLSSSPAAMPRLTSQAGAKVSPCITIQQGSLTNVVADVYVDTTSADLDLKSRPVSKVLLQAGGQALQDECTKHVQQNGNVLAWSFATTGPGTLKCKHVLHTVASDYDGPGGSAEKGMEDMLHRVLEECDRLKATSVAIPSIGAGNFKFPPSVLASLMLRTVSSYFNKNRNSTVTKVLFVIFDGNLLKEFQEAQSGSPQTHPAKKSKSSAAARSNECTLQCNNLRVSIVHGDITKESSEAIVNTAPDDLELNNFGVQGAFLRMGGPELQAECRAVVQNEGRLSGNKIRVTGPGRMGGLKCRQVLHILAPKTPVKLKGTVKAILNAVNKLGLRTVALPAIGTGQHGFKTDQAAKHICEAIVEFSKHPNALLREVRIVVFDKSLCSDFFNKFQSNGERLGVWAAIKGHIFYAADAMGKWLGAANDSRDDSASDDEEDSNQSCTEQLSDQFSSMSLHQPYRESSYLVLSVYAQTKEIVSTVIKELHAVVDKEFVTEPVQEDLIQELSDDFVAELYQRAGDLQVELDLDREVGSVTMKGAKTNVGQAKLFLKEILHQIEMNQTTDQFEVERAKKEEQQMEKQSNLAASIFRWQRIISGQFEDFPHNVSFFIEQARLDNQPACRIPGEAGEEYEVDFTSMTIRDGSGNSGEVHRFDFEEDRKKAQKQLAEGGHIVYPTHWEPMPVDSKGREAVFHPVVLSANDQEYKEVLQGFEKTMTTQFNPNGMSHYTSILAIKRIQNPTLYNTYVARRTVMEKANPKGTQNERRLFHGCAVDAVVNICQTGFNRSFCGKNATAIGKGSYFAVNALYSAGDKYSPRNNNDNGKKHVFFARVLTGEFTQGHANLQDPPSKDAQSKFDSVVDNPSSPGMYVVFYDAQAYPDYLIEFN